jgi:hypothetical protein
VSRPAVRRGLSIANGVVLLALGVAVAAGVQKDPSAMEI